MDITSILSRPIQPFVFQEIYYHQSVLVLKQIEIIVKPLNPFHKLHCNVKPESILVLHPLQILQCCNYEWQSFAIDDLSQVLTKEICGCIWKKGSHKMMANPVQQVVAKW